MLQVYNPIFIFIGGSRSIGLETDKSDYDLFFITEPNTKEDISRTDIMEYYFFDKNSDKNVIHYNVIPINYILTSPLLSIHRLNGIIKDCMNISNNIIWSKNDVITNEVNKIIMDDELRVSFLKEATRFINENAIERLKKTRSLDSIILEEVKSLQIILFPLVLLKYDITFYRDIYFKISEYDYVKDLPLELKCNIVDIMVECFDFMLSEHNDISSRDIINDRQMLIDKIYYELNMEDRDER